jgi:hypothetical protein
MSPSSSKRRAAHRALINLASEGNGNLDLVKWIGSLHGGAE